MIVRVPLIWLLRVLVELVRDVLEALAVVVYGLGRVASRLLGIATVVLILYAILVRVTVDVAMPPVVWSALAGAWLAATVLWLVGGLLLHAARPRLAWVHVRRGRGRPSVSARRIQDWESAWLRALRYQAMAGGCAHGGYQRASERERQHERGSATSAGSPYEVLGVEPGVNQEELRAAYRELARRMHPDRNPGFVAEAAERFAAINAAYELLSDPGRRAAFDQRCRGD